MAARGIGGEEASGRGRNEPGFDSRFGDRSHCVWGIGVNDAVFCRCLLMI